MQLNTRTEKNRSAATHGRSFVRSHVKAVEHLEDTMSQEPEAGGNVET